MNIDTLVFALFLLSIPVAWWAGHHRKAWMPMLAVTVTTLVGLRALFLLEFGSLALAGALGTFFLAGLLGVWIGVKRAQE